MLLIKAMNNSQQNPNLFCVKLPHTRMRNSKYSTAMAADAAYSTYAHNYVLVPMKRCRVANRGEHTSKSGYTSASKNGNISYDSKHSKFS